MILARSPLTRVQPSFLHFHQRRITTMNILGGILGGTSSKEGKGLGSTKRGCELAPAKPPEGLEIATVAGGCFWGLELAYQRVPGVTYTSVGYTGGHAPSPTYEEVCTGKTGHAEAVQMYYSPDQVSYNQLLDVFFKRVDPTTHNRQGNDSGSQYRSVIYYHNEAQKKAAAKAIDAVSKQLAAGTFRQVGGNKVVTTLEPATDFYIAEDYHQQYLASGGRLGKCQSAAKGCSDPIRCYG